MNKTDKSLTDKGVFHDMSIRGANNIYLRDVGTIYTHLE